ncbi:MAG TPA: hypothetical protein VK745_27645 [Polyangiaceae bacterium]|jgi:hypothetical protein|nr:hypothetical protein [Polyangiaceae bacterium]
MQQFEFVENRSGLWLVGILVLVVGLLAAILIVPSVAQTPDPGGPDIHLPKMGTLPPQDAPKVSVQGNRDREAQP